MSVPPTSPLSRRALVAGTYVPALVFDIGIGAVLPVIVARSVDLGADLVRAGLLTALLAIGKLLADVPAGWYASRVGDRRAMITAALVAAASMFAAAVVPSIVGFAVALLVMGAAWAVFNLARHSHLTEVVPTAQRARTLSTLAGMHRIGLFIGPVVGAAAIAVADVRACFALAAATSLVSALVVLSVREVGPVAAGATAGAALPGLRPAVAPTVYATLGMGVLLVGAVRGVRAAVLPLWSEHLGFAPEVTSIVFAASSLLDMLLFYPAGALMDRKGRLWAAVPSMLTMAAAYVVLPWATTLTTFTLVAGLLGVGNGLGSGIVMTLGSDVAPAGRARARHLGLWRVFQDVGDGGGPLLLAAAAAAGTLAAGIWVSAGVAVGACLVLGRWVPRLVPSELDRRPDSSASGEPVPAAAAGCDDSVGSPSA